MKTEFLEQPSYTAVPYNQQVTVYKIVAYKLFLSHSLLIVNKQDSYYKKQQQYSLLKVIMQTLITV